MPSMIYSMRNPANPSERVFVSNVGGEFRQYDPATKTWFAIDAPLFAAPSYYAPYYYPQPYPFARPSYYPMPGYAPAQVFATPTRPLAPSTRVVVTPWSVKYGIGFVVAA